MENDFQRIVLVHRSISSARNEPNYCTCDSVLMHSQIAMWCSFHWCPSHLRIIFGVKCINLGGYVLHVKSTRRTELANISRQKITWLDLDSSLLITASDSKSQFTASFTQKKNAKKSWRKRTETQIKRTNPFFWGTWQHGNMATGGRLTRSDSQTPGHLVQLGQLGGPGTRRHQKFAAFFWTYVARDKLLKSRSSAEQRLLVPCKAQLLQLLDKQQKLFKVSWDATWWPFWAIFVALTT